MSSPEQVLIDGLLRELAQARAGNLSKALQRYFGNENADVKVSVHRDRAMISVADGGLETLEHDHTLKSYTDHNHMFADLLVPVGSRVSVPMLFWLSLANKPGVSVALLRHLEVYIVSLGKPYSFADICANISHVLGQQKLSVKYHWFGKNIEKHGLDPADAAFRNIV
jgi:hypothetical protein